MSSFEGYFVSIFYRYFAALGLDIHLVGVEFSKASRNIVGFEFETLAIS